MDFDSFVQILWASPVRPRASGGVFCDLGSGSGRAVFAAAMLHDFDKCLGIEVLASLHATATSVATVRVLQAALALVTTHAPLACAQCFERDVRPRLSGNQRFVDIQFVRSSFLTYDWSDADFVFANSTWYVRACPARPLSSQQHRDCIMRCVIRISFEDHLMVGMASCARWCFTRHSARRAPSPSRLSG